MSIPPGFPSARVTCQRRLSACRRTSPSRRAWPGATGLHGYAYTSQLACASKYRRHKESTPSPRPLRYRRAESAANAGNDAMDTSGNVSRSRAKYRRVSGVPTRRAVGRCPWAQATPNMSNARPALSARMRIIGSPIFRRPSAWCARGPLASHARSCSFPRHTWVPFVGQQLSCRRSPVPSSRS